MTKSNKSDHLSKLNHEKKKADQDHVKANLRASDRKHKLNVRIKKAEVKENNPEERILNNEDFIEGFDEKVDIYVDKYVEKVERTKRLTMISGVGFFMLLILFLYVYNLKIQISTIANGNNEEEGIEITIDDIRNNFDNIVGEYKELKGSVVSEMQDNDVEELLEIVENEEQKVLPATESKELLKTEVIESLKEKLLEDKLEQ